MRALNVLLALAVSALLAGLVLEGGLRLLGFGPPNTGIRFDSQLGWALRPNSGFTNSGRKGEFDVKVKTDAHGLRDDYGSDVTKPDGTFRVLCLGDSFTLGYTVDRDDLFVDLLETWWAAEGRKVEVVNAGVQGYSTDQMLRWLAVHGAKWSPDVVLMLSYENDIVWNLQDSYAGSSKPVYGVDGTLETEGDLQDTGRRKGLRRPRSATCCSARSRRSSGSRSRSPTGRASRSSPSRRRSSSIRPRSSPKRRRARPRS